MTHLNITILSTFAFVIALIPVGAGAFNSGSTGADLDLAPSVSVEIPLPPNGVLNYRSINIPAGVTVTFKRNATNTPVFMLVQNDASIHGTIDVRGQDSPALAFTDGNPADDGHIGKGGPGGFDGGRGGIPGEGLFIGGNGLGPGGGSGGTDSGANRNGRPAGHATPGMSGQIPFGGKAYGSAQMLPLIGGSGGGGGFPFVDPTRSIVGVGGAGGGGAVLLAVSGTLTISPTGKLLADGGSPGNNRFDPGNTTGGGGPGSGGSIRLVATTIMSQGTISAVGGTFASLNVGGLGRIRIEADVLGQVNATNPTFVSGLPGPVFLANTPMLRFVSVGGTAVSSAPVGFQDVTLAPGAGNPVAVALSTAGIPPGALVKVTASPIWGPAISVDAAPTVGSLTSATTTVNVNIPTGHTVLSAETTFVLTAAASDALSRFAQGERIERVTLRTDVSGAITATGSTDKGNRIDLPLRALSPSLFY